MEPSPQFTKLREAVVSGQAVFITGTGVAVAACGDQEVEGHKIATWMGLLEHGAHYLKTIGAADNKAVDRLIDQISSGETDFMISAAEMIEGRMKRKSEGLFRGWLKDTIGQLKIQDPSLLEALHALPGVLATLNYDHLLEEATGRQPLTWKQPDAMQDTLRHASHWRGKVLHLHGHFQDPESVVLGVSSYDRVKSDPHAETVLRSFFVERTVVFVGCGATLHDPNFRHLIEWGREALRDVAPRHVVLCRDSEITDIHNKLSEAPWLQPLAYGQTHADLAPFLKQLAPTTEERQAGASQPAPPLSSLDLAAYRQTITQQHGRLKLEDLDATTCDMRPLPVSKLFIELNARECGEYLPRALELPKELQRRLREQGALEGTELDEDALERHRRSYLDQSPRPVLEVVADPEARKLVVLGDPGSGKSLLLQFMALAWAEQTLPASGDAPLPLLIDLRDYARLRHEKVVTGFREYLQNAESMRWQFDGASLEHWLSHQPSRVMFDGLDEVFDPDLRKEVSTAIHRFADVYPKAQILVTSRVIGFSHQSWRDGGFRLFMLQELDEEQRATFLRRWHQACYDDVTRGESKRALLSKAIAHSPAIAQLSGNPLLLTLMAILNRTQELPRDRVELYHQCARLLLHQWKTEAAFAAIPELSKASLDYKDKRQLLMDVAWHLQSSPKGLAGNLIAEEDLEHTLTDGLRGFPDLRPARAARALIEQLRGRNFMLCAVGSQSYAFVHRTFLEYFCALAIVDRFERKQTLSIERLQNEMFGHWPEETWHEVLTLVAGMIDPKFVKDILLWLLEQPDPEQTCESIFLAARCVGEVRQRQGLGSVEANVRERLKALSRFDLDFYYEAWEDEDYVVRAIRQQSVQLFSTIWGGLNETKAWLKERSQPDDNWAVRQIAVQELARGWKDDPDIIHILKERAQSDEILAVRQSAIQEFARGWQNDPDTLLWLKERAQPDENIIARQIALGEIARGWKKDPDTLPWLRELAQSGEDSILRISAMRVIARGWQNDPNTLHWLKERAQPDENIIARQIAVGEIALGWKNDSDTLPWLKKLAQSDENIIVRQIAVQALAQGWKGDPDTLPILKDLVQSDENRDVKNIALLELALGWKGDSNTLPILKDLAESDEDSDLRASALLALSRGWRDNPNTLPWLKERAQSDKSAGVRQIVVQELARSWKNDADTLPILKERIQLDIHEDVRQIALRELARGWKNDPDTLPFLKDRAQSNEHKDVRQIALKVLARGWKNDPDTLPILKDRAQSDAHEDVRQIALQELSRGWKIDPDVQIILKDNEEANLAGNEEK